MINANQAAKITAFKECFVACSPYDRALRNLHRLFNNQRLGGEQPSMLITGESGTGKSSLIKQFKDEVLASQQYPKNSCPILSTRVAAKVTLEDTLKGMLINLGMFGYSNNKRHMSDNSLTTRLIRCLAECQTQLIIINEFQELMEYKRNNERQAIGNRLKLLTEQTSIPIVFVGMPWAAEITQDPQWASRLSSYRIHLNYFKLSDDPKRYAKFLKEISSKLPFDKPSHLEQEDIAFPLFAASRGELREIKKLLASACEYAFEEHALSLKKQHLALSFDQHFADKPNPFELPLEEIRISEIEEQSGYYRGRNPEDSKIIDPTYSKPRSLTELLSKH